MTKHLILSLFIGSCMQLVFAQGPVEKKTCSSIFLGSLELAIENTDVLNPLSFQDYILKEVAKTHKLSFSDFSQKSLFTFEVNKQGMVSKVKVVKGVSSELDTAFINAIEATSEMWEPALKKGKTVNSIIQLPILVSKEQFSALFE
ncbi:energy transducer TonB [Saccharicrinis aurantiacus]|uniref:energy transducer TonB n=1 Tax=Saccharicrinis aurantiacus TaxID=1849719 RepID=UPI002491372E|nr:energy transducer TonB [Saccharicrinis aurantiacus]